MGEILSISQFTLCADVKKGNRPSFSKAGRPEFASDLYKYFNECIRDNGINCKEGYLSGWYEGFIIKWWTSDYYSWFRLFIIL